MNLQSYNDVDTDYFGVQYTRHISGSNAHEIRRRLGDHRFETKGMISNGLVLLQSVYNARVENGFMGLQRFHRVEKDIYIW